MAGLLTPEIVYRNWEVDGVPDSGKHEPVKAEIVQLLNALFGVTASGWVTAGTKAALLAVVPEEETSGGVVLNDPVTANNGYYYRAAAAWVKGRGFPDTLARLTVTGGSANVVLASAAPGVDPATVLAYFIDVATANTGNVTVSINGGATIPAYNVNGAQFTAGEWQGRLFLSNEGTSLKALNDAAASASAAASATEAGDARDDAEVFANLLGAAAQLYFFTVAAVVADTSMGYTGSGALKIVAINQIIEGGGYRYKVAASGVSDHHLITAGGVKLYVQQNDDGSYSLRAFGAVGDGVTDDYAVIAKAEAACKADGIDRLLFGKGNFAWGTTIAKGGNPQVTWIGQDKGRWENGSSLPASVLTWLGGASPMITCAGSEDCFVGFGVVNKGGATDFIEYLSGAIRHRFYDMSFDLLTGATAFSRSIIRSTGNRLGYSRFSRMQVAGGAAPRFIDIDGGGTGIGITPFVIDDRSIFRSGLTQPLAVVYVKACTLDSLVIRDCTFNQNSIDELIIVDTTDTPETHTIRNLVFSENEIDGSSVDVTDVMFKLVNVPNFSFDQNNVVGGNRNKLGTLVNSRLVSCSGNYAQSMNQGMFDLDATSYFNIGLNGFDLTSSRGIVNDSAPGIIPLPWAAGTTTNIQGDRAPSSGKVLRISVTAAGSWTLSYHHPTSGYLIPGQQFTIQIKNTSGGAISAPNGSVFVVAGASWGTMPATGFQRSWTFVFDGVSGKFHELHRSSGDVSNT